MNGGSQITDPIKSTRTFSSNNQQASEQLKMGWFKNPFAAQPTAAGSNEYNPSPFTLMAATQSKSSYAPDPTQETKYTGSKPILVVCTDESLMEMANQTKFNTGNHPIEMLVPMLHFQTAGFTFEFATFTGGAVKLEMWAFPNKDENVKKLYEEVKASMDAPKKLDEIKSVDDYSAVFIPGGHGSMINLPKSVALGALLHLAHDSSMPTVTLCHGPAALLSTATGDKEFAYKDYETMCFTDKTDAFTPKIGYLPGPMPWKCQESIEAKGMKVMNTGEKGSVMQHRELITGDSPTAAQNLGKFAAPILVQWANENKV